jgi:hypothetical protein
MAQKAVADPSRRKSIRRIRRIRPSGPFCESCESFPQVMSAREMPVAQARALRCNETTSVGRTGRTGRRPAAAILMLVNRCFGRSDEARNARLKKAGLLPALCSSFPEISRLGRRQGSVPDQAEPLDSRGMSRFVTEPVASIEHVRNGVDPGWETNLGYRLSSGESNGLIVATVTRASVIRLVRQLAACPSAQPPKHIQCCRFFQESHRAVGQG